ncbi:hypothetical protein LFL97_09400 [Burkholderia sp. JSH-S8]|nr:hypothetical protein LFL97_09400 [Burkholderia sp. JSH-S8]
MADPFEDLKKEHADWHKEHRVETYKSMIVVSHEAYKYLALLNGGAAAGMLANSTKLLELVGVSNFRVSLELFAWGLVSTAVALIFSWLTQNRLHNENLLRSENAERFRRGQPWVPYTEWHKLFVRLALVATMSSVVLFAWGAIRAAKHIH